MEKLKEKLAGIENLQAELTKFKKLGTEPEKVTELEKELAKVDKKYLNLDVNNVQFIIPNGKIIEATDNNINIVKRLLKRYNSIQKLENHKERYHRGNNECAVVFTSPKIAATFVRQFDKDWKYSEIKEAEPYMPSFSGGLSSLQKFITQKEPRLDRFM